MLFIILSWMLSLNKSKFGSYFYRYKKYVKCKIYIYLLVCLRTDETVRSSPGFLPPGFSKPLDLGLRSVLSLLDAVPCM